MAQTPKGKRRFFLRKFIAFFLSISFSLSSLQIVHADALQAGSASRHGDLVPDFDPGTFELPEELGAIIDIYRPSVNGTEPPSWIVYLQEPHGNPDAAQNLMKTIQWLEKNHPLTEVYLEGGEGRFDSLLFQSFPAQEDKQRLINQYLNSGEISAAEGAAILSGPDSKIRYQGIETQNLYLKNKEAFLAARQNEEKVRAVLDSMKSDLDQLESAIKNSSVKKFYEVYAQFQKGKIGFPDYIEELGQVSPAGETLTFPELAKVRSAARKFREDTDATQLEVRSFVGQFKKEMLPYLDAKVQKLAIQAIQAYETEQRHAGALLRDLRMLTDNKIDIPKPLQSILQETLLLDSVQAPKIMDELARFEAFLRGELPQSSEEQKLLKAQKIWGLYEKLSRFELMPEEWRDLQQVLEAPEQKDHENVFSAHLTFYKLAEKRDHALFENLKGHLERSGPRLAVLVTGGFHTDAMTQKMQASQRPYILIQPAVNSDEDREPYFRALEGKRSFMKYFKNSHWEAFAQDFTQRVIKMTAASEQDFILKRWRDEIIKSLAAERRITKAGDYTVYIDAMASAENLYDFSRFQEKVLERFDIFSEGVRGLWENSHFDPGLLQPIFDRMSTARKSSLAAELVLIREPMEDRGHFFAAIFDHKAEPPLSHHSVETVREQIRDVRAELRGQSKIKPETAEEAEGRAALQNYTRAFLSGSSVGNAKRELLKFSNRGIPIRASEKGSIYLEQTLAKRGHISSLPPRKVIWIHPREDPDGSVYLEIDAGADDRRFYQWADKFWYLEQRLIPGMKEIQGYAAAFVAGENTDEAARRLMMFEEKGIQVPLPPKGVLSFPKAGRKAWTTFFFKPGTKEVTVYPKKSPDGEIYLFVKSPSDEDRYYRFIKNPDRYLTVRQGEGIQELLNYAKAFQKRKNPEKEKKALLRYQSKGIVMESDSSGILHLPRIGQKATSIGSLKPNAEAVLYPREDGHGALILELRAAEREPRFFRFEQDDNYLRSRLEPGFDEIRNYGRAFLSGKNKKKAEAELMAYEKDGIQVLVPESGRVSLPVIDKKSAALQSLPPGAMIRIIPQRAADGSVYLKIEILGTGEARYFGFTKQKGNYLEWQPAPGLKEIAEYAKLLLGDKRLDSVRNKLLAFKENGFPVTISERGTLQFPKVKISFEVFGLTPGEARVYPESDPKDPKKMMLRVVSGGQNFYYVIVKRPRYILAVKEEGVSGVAEITAYAETLIREREKSRRGSNQEPSAGVAGITAYAGVLKTGVSFGSAAVSVDDARKALLEFESSGIKLQATPAGLVVFPRSDEGHTQLVGFDANAEVIIYPKADLHGEIYLQVESPGKDPRYFRFTTRFKQSFLESRSAPGMDEIEEYVIARRSGKGIKEAEEKLLRYQESGFSAKVPPAGTMSFPAAGIRIGGSAQNLPGGAAVLVYPERLPGGEIYLRIRVSEKDHRYYEILPEKPSYLSAMPNPGFKEIRDYVRVLRAGKNSKKAKQRLLAYEKTGIPIRVGEKGFISLPKVGASNPSLHRLPAGHEIRIYPREEEDGFIYLDLRIPGAKTRFYRIVNRKYYIEECYGPGMQEIFNYAGAMLSGQKTENYRKKLLSYQGRGFEVEGNASGFFFFPKVRRPVMFRDIPWVPGMRVEPKTDITGSTFFLKMAIPGRTNHYFAFRNAPVYLRELDAPDDADAERQSVEMTGDREIMKKWIAAQYGRSGDFKVSIDITALMTPEDLRQGLVPEDYPLPGGKVWGSQNRDMRVGRNLKNVTVFIRSEAGKFYFRFDVHRNELRSDISRSNMVRAQSNENRAELRAKKSGSGKPKLSGQSEFVFNPETGEMELVRSEIYEQQKQKPKTEYEKSIDVFTKYQVLDIAVSLSSNPDLMNQTLAILLHQQGVEMGDDELARLSRAFILNLREGQMGPGGSPLKPGNAFDYLRALIKLEDHLTRMEEYDQLVMIRAFTRLAFYDFARNIEDSKKKMTELLSGFDSKSPFFKKLIEHVAYELETGLQFQPDHMQTALKPHQRVGSWGMRSSEKMQAEGIYGFLLEDDTRLGKTIQTFAAMDPSWKAAIVVPAGVMDTWEEQYYQHTKGRMKFVPVRGSPEQKRQLIEENKDKKGVILLFSIEDLQSKTPEDLAAISEGLDVLVVDEAQKIENFSGQSAKTSSFQAKAIHQIRTSRKWLLSASPYTSHPRQLFSIFHLLHTDPKTGKVTDPIYATPQSFNRILTRNLKQMRWLYALKARVGVRRTKNEMGDMYSKKNEVHPDKEGLYTVSSEQAELTLRVIKNLGEYLKIYNSRVPPEDRFPESSLGVLLKLQFLNWTVTDPALLGEQIPTTFYQKYVEIVERRVGNGQKGIVFAQNTEMVNNLVDLSEKRGIKVARIDGTVDGYALDENGHEIRGYYENGKLRRDPGGRRITAKAYQRHLFQEDPETKLVIMNVRAGVGLDLSAADFVLYAQPPQNYVEYYQSSDRSLGLNPGAGTGTQKTVDVVHMIAHYPESFTKSKAGTDDERYVKFGSPAEILYQGIMGEDRQRFELVIEGLPAPENVSERRAMTRLIRSIPGFLDDPSMSHRNKKEVRRIEAVHQFYPLYQKLKGQDPAAEEKILRLVELFARTEIQAARFAKAAAGSPRFSIQDLDWVEGLFRIPNKMHRDAMLAMLPDVLENVWKHEMSLSELIERGPPALGQAASNFPELVLPLLAVTHGWNVEVSNVSGSLEHVHLGTQVLFQIVEQIQQSGFSLFDQRKLLNRWIGAMITVTDLNQTALLDLTAHLSDELSNGSLTLERKIRFFETLAVLCEASRAGYDRILAMRRSFQETETVLYQAMQSSFMDLFGLADSEETRKQILRLSQQWGSIEAPVRIMAKLRSGGEEYREHADLFSRAVKHMLDGTYPAWRNEANSDLTGHEIEYKAGEPEFWKTFTKEEKQALGDVTISQRDYKETRVQLAGQIHKMMGDDKSDVLTAAYGDLGKTIRQDLSNPMGVEMLENQIRQAGIRRHSTDLNTAEELNAIDAEINLIRTRLDAVKLYHQLKASDSEIPELLRLVRVNREAILVRNQQATGKIILESMLKELEDNLEQFGKPRKFEAVEVEFTSDPDLIMRRGMLDEELKNCFNLGYNVRQIATLVDDLVSRNKMLAVVRTKGRIVSSAVVKVRRTADGKPVMFIEKPLYRWGYSFEREIAQALAVTKQPSMPEASIAGYSAGEEMIEVHSTGARAPTEYHESLFGVRDRPYKVFHKANLLYRAAEEMKDSDWAEEGITHADFKTGSEAQQLWGIGHSNRSVGEFLAQAKRAGITAIVDLRSKPMSQYYPHFNRDNFQVWLAENGIDYVWLGDDLGGKIPEFNDDFEAFMRANPHGRYTSGIDRLVKIVKERKGKGKAAILCSEGAVHECHRRFVLKDLQGQNRAELRELKRSEQRTAETHPVTARSEARSRMPLDVFRNYLHDVVWGHEHRSVNSLRPFTMQGDAEGKIIFGTVDEGRSAYVRSVLFKNRIVKITPMRDGFNHVYFEMTTRNKTAYYLPLTFRPYLRQTRSPGAQALTEYLSRLWIPGLLEQQERAYQGLIPFTLRAWKEKLHIGDFLAMHASIPVPGARNAQEVQVTPIKKKEEVRLQVRYGKETHYYRVQKKPFFIPYDPEEEAAKETLLEDIQKLYTAQTDFAETPFDLSLLMSKEDLKKGLIPADFPLPGGKVWGPGNRDMRAGKNFKSAKVFIKREGGKFFFRFEGYRSELRDAAQIFLQESWGPENIAAMSDLLTSAKRKSDSPEPFLASLKQSLDQEVQAWAEAARDQGVAVREKLSGLQEPAMLQFELGRESEQDLEELVRAVLETVSQIETLKVRFKASEAAPVRILKKILSRRIDEMPEQVRRRLRQQISVSGHEETPAAGVRTVTVKRIGESLERRANSVEVMLDRTKYADGTSAEKASSVYFFAAGVAALLDQPLEDLILNQENILRVRSEQALYGFQMILYSLAESARAEMRTARSA